MHSLVQLAGASQQIAYCICTDDVRLEATTQSIRIGANKRVSFRAKPHSVLSSNKNRFSSALDSLSSGSGASMSLTSTMMTDDLVVCGCSLICNRIRSSANKPPPLHSSLHPSLYQLPLRFTQHSWRYQRNDSNNHRISTIGFHDASATAAVHGLCVNRVAVVDKSQSTCGL